MWTMLDTDLVRKHGGLEPKTVKYRWTIHTHKRKFVFPTKNYSNDDIEQINITWTHDQNGSIYIGVLNGSQGLRYMMRLSSIFLRTFTS
jgi:hypothetical protein